MHARTKVTLGLLLAVACGVAFHATALTSRKQYESNEADGGETSALYQTEGILEDVEFQSRFATVTVEQSEIFSEGQEVSFLFPNTHGNDPSYAAGDRVRVRHWSYDIGDGKTIVAHSVETLASE